MTTSRLPVLFAQTAPALRRPAPLLGERNEEILRVILGLTEEQVAALVLGDAISAYS